MKKDELTSQIAVIENALLHTRNISTTAKYYYILWGAILTIHFLLNYIVSIGIMDCGKALTNISISLFPIGGILSYKKKKYDNNLETAQSHYERAYFYGMIAFATSYVILFIHSIREESILYLQIYPLITGMGVFFIGGVVKHKYSVILGFLGSLGSIYSLSDNDATLYLIASFVSFTSFFLTGLLMKNGEF